MCVRPQLQSAELPRGIHQPGVQGAGREAGQPRQGRRGQRQGADGRHHQGQEQDIHDILIAVHAILSILSNQKL